LGAGVFIGSDGKNGCPKRPTNQFRFHEPHEPNTPEEAAQRVRAFLDARRPTDDLPTPVEVLRVATTGPDVVLLTTDLDQLVQAVLPAAPADPPAEWMISSSWVCSHLVVRGEHFERRGVTYEVTACGSGRYVGRSRLLPEPTGIDTTDRCLPCRRHAAELGVNGEE
jgi:hypothetical protein